MTTNRTARQRSACHLWASQIPNIAISTRILNTYFIIFMWVGHKFEKIVDGINRNLKNNFRSILSLAKYRSSLVFAKTPKYRSIYLCFAKGLGTERVDIIPSVTIDDT
ncbi:5091_t:CDS:2 [Ambispora gerdemannii]|uniref:5091_t:CDS:1 n=1 Tax=Ambispora gerdemannii TaxID=144530 RepID=A0A9N8Z644_9GLOM|nr:5091_t:CDS:2 [Ambispora gerdemannii]